MHQITTNYAGEVKEEESKRQKPRRKAKAADPDERLKEMEKEFINQTQLRAARLQQLEALNEEGGGLDVPRVPDGVGAPLLIGGVAGGGLLMNAHTAAPSSLSLATVTKEGASGVMLQGETRSVLNPLSCYICRKPYRELHFFYSHLCPDCALFNWSKRQETADLTGMYDFHELAALTPCLLILSRQVCARHRWPAENRFPVLPETAPLWSAPHRDHTLSRGRCQTIPAGARQRALARSIARVWAGLQGHRCAGAILLLRGQVLPVPSYNHQQRVSNGAAPPRVLCSSS